MKKTHGIEVGKGRPVISDSGAIRDSGTVQIGAYSPAFPPPARATPSIISDSGNVRLGAFSPAFPPPRNK